MGLVISHDAYEGSYSNFNSWRSDVALLIGVDFFKMENAFGDIPWSTLPKDDLHILLNHSDCEGQFSWQEANKIANRLTQLLPLIKDERCLLVTKRFINGCDEAVRLKESLLFN